MLEKKKKRIGYYSASRIVERCVKDTRTENPSAEHVVRYMLGDSDNWFCGDFVVYKYDDKVGRTMFNRLNLLWVWPICVLLIPVQYIVTGECGFNRNSRAGRVLDWLVKFD